MIIIDWQLFAEILIKGVCVRIQTLSMCGTKENELFLKKSIRGPNSQDYMGDDFQNSPSAIVTEKADTQYCYRRFVNSCQ